MSFSPPFAEYTKEITSIVSQLPHIFTTYAKSLLDEYVIEVINDPQLLFKLLITYASHKIDQKTSMSLKQLKDFRNKTEHGKFISKETVVRGFLHLQIVFDSFHRENSNLEWKLGVDKSEIKIVFRKWENILVAVGIKVKEVTIDDKNYVFSSSTHSSSSSPQKPQNYCNKSTDPETPQKIKKNQWGNKRNVDSSDEDENENEDIFPREHFRKDYPENIFFSPKVKENSFFDDFTPFSRMPEEKINVKREVKKQEEEKERSSISSSSDSSSERSSSSSNSSNRGSKENSDKGGSGLRDSIRNLKAKYQAAIKNIPLVIEDGKYKGKEGKIIGFNGTNVWMLLDGEPNKIAIPLDRIIILRSSP